MLNTHDAPFLSEDLPSQLEAAAPASDESVAKDKKASVELNKLSKRLHRQVGRPSSTTT